MQIMLTCVFTAHSSFCGSMNVKDLVTGDSAHLKHNGSLCEYTQTDRHTHTNPLAFHQFIRSLYFFSFALPIKHLCVFCVCSLLFEFALVISVFVCVCVFCVWRHFVCVCVCVCAPSWPFVPSHPPRFVGTPGDDCKGKQSSHAAVTRSVLLVPQSSRTRRLGGALLSFLAYTGSWKTLNGASVGPQLE